MGGEVTRRSVAGRGNSTGAVAGASAPPIYLIAGLPGLGCELAIMPRNTALFEASQKVLIGERGRQFRVSDDSDAAIVMQL